MFEVSVLPAFDFLSEEYAALFAASSATPFQHPIWLSAMYGRLVPSRGAQPLIVTIRDASNRLLMVLPLLRRRYGLLRVIEFADLGVADYNAAICEASALPALLADQSVRIRIRKALKPFDLIRISKMAADEAHIQGLLGLSGSLPMDTRTYATPLVQPFSAWREAYLNRSFGKELTRKWALLQRKGEVQFTCCNDAEQIRTVFAAMREHRLPRYAAEGGDLLQQPDYFDFYLSVAIKGIGGFIRTYSMSVNGEPAACIVGPTHPGKFLVVLVGSDIQAYKNVSIGGLMFEQVARDCVERGDKVLDFTVGDEPYKKLFGAEAAPLWMSLGSGSPVGAIANAALTRLPRARALAKKALRRYNPAPPVSLPSPSAKS